MKIDVFILPKNGEVRLAPATFAKQPPGKGLQPQGTLVLGSPWKLAVLSVLLLGILTVCGLAVYSAYKAISAMEEHSPKRAKAAAGHTGAPIVAEDESRVRHFDNSRPLQRGDVVVVNQNGSSKVRQVAAAANRTVLVKHGNAVEAFYVLGEDSYLVASEHDRKVVRAHEILATVASPVSAPRQH
jgi:hypothetical protein